MEKPKISIIIPVYNVEKWLNSCLLSVENQSFQEWEAIVIDDASSDNSFDIAHKFELQDSRFKILRLPENLGLGGARNAGCLVAQGDYLFFLDSDDLLPKNILMDMYEVAQKEEADMLIGDFYTFFDGKVEPSTEKMYPANPVFFKNFPYPHVVITWRDMSNNFDLFMISNYSTTCWGKLFKRNLWQELGCHSPQNLRMAEDFIPVKKMIFGSKRIVPYPYCVILYRKRSGSATTKRSLKAFEIIRAYPEAKKMFFEFFPNFEMNEYFEKFFILAFRDHMYFLLPYSKWYSFFKETACIIERMDYAKKIGSLNGISLKNWSSCKIKTFAYLILMPVNS